MELTYGFSPYLDRLGIKPRRPYSLSVANQIFVGLNTQYNMDLVLDAGGDFLIESIMVDTNYGGGYNDGFLGFEVLPQHLKCYNRNGAFLNGGPGNPWLPFTENRNQPTPFTLPWILHSGERLRFTWFSPFGIINVGDLVVVVNGWQLSSVGQESPFLPFVWCLRDNADLTVGSLAITDSIQMNGPSDFICVAVSSKEEFAIGDRILQNNFNEGASEGGYCWQDRQTWGTGSYIRCWDESSEPVFPVPWVMPNGTVVRTSYDNDRVVPGTVRRPQLALFGFYLNPLVWPQADLERGLL